MQRQLREMFHTTIIMVNILDTGKEKTPYQRPRYKEIMKIAEWVQKMLGIEVVEIGEEHERWIKILVVPLNTTRGYKRDIEEHLLERILDNDEFRIDYPVIIMPYEPDISIRVQMLMRRHRNYSIIQVNGESTELDGLIKDDFRENFPGLVNMMEEIHENERRMYEEVNMNEFRDVELI